MQVETQIRNEQNVLSGALNPLTRFEDLTLMQQRFVVAYCGPEARGKGATAARIAGYEGNENTLATVAYENLRKPAISAAIEERLNALAMHDGEILTELSEVGRADWRKESNRLSAGEKVKALDVLAKIRRMYEPAQQVTQNVQINIVATAQGALEIALANAEKVRIEQGVEYTREQIIAGLVYYRPEFAEHLK